MSFWSIESYIDFESEQDSEILFCFFLLLNFYSGQHCLLHGVLFFFLALTFKTSKTFRAWERSLLLYSVTFYYLSPFILKKKCSYLLMYQLLRAKKSVWFYKFSKIALFIYKWIFFIPYPRWYSTGKITV